MEVGGDAEITISKADNRSPTKIDLDDAWQPCTTLQLLRLWFPDASPEDVP